MFTQWRAKRNLQRILRARDRAYVKERANLLSQDDFARWASEWDVEIMFPAEEYDILRTAHWRRKAISRLVELPPRNEEEEYWEQTQPTGKWVLTDQGIAYIRSAVRQEALASSEMWFGVAALLLGVLAVLASVINRF
jgi:hypothetical protein